MDWKLTAVASTLSGELVGDGAVAISGVTTDSRSVTPGSLFVAIVGDNFDGHDFCEAALADGAIAVVCERGRCDATPRVEVADTKRALLDLAIARREELDVPVIAITGSTGKTSTKDLTAAAMGDNAWSSPASYNNEIGVPLTVLGAPNTVSSLVIEVGSRGRGHIAALLGAVKPDVAVITNLGLVHIETFGTLVDLAAAKSELIEGLGDGGVAVLPFGEDRLAFDGTTIRFGTDAAADVTVSDVELDATGRPTFTLAAFDEQRPMKLAMAGSHQPLNAAAAVAAAVAAGRDLDAAIAGAEEATGSPWRMDIATGRFVVINDAYNANPTSTQSALETAAELGTHLIAVLGVMAELGDMTEAEHERIGALAASLGFDEVVVVGDAPGLAAGAGSVATSVPDMAAAKKRVLDVAREGSVVLVKGSRVAGLEVLAAELAEEAAA